MPGTPSKASLILVEDNERLREELANYLREEGFDVRGVDGGQALNQALLERRADVLILDLNMAEEDGISIAKRMRISSPEVGIVMLTARVQSIDKQNGYQSGADVYMTKPARPAELVAALRNLLARLAPQVKQTHWILDTTMLSIRFQQTTSIALTIAEAKLLKTLALNNACVELEELQLVLDHQSEDAAKNKLRLEVLISRLRSKLSPHLGEFNPIKSVRGRGYQLCMPLAIE
jgi:DNA-binding response OmpR family regulator